MKGNSGRFLLRLPKDTHRLLSEEAAHLKLSLNQLVLSRIIAGEKKPNSENIFLMALLKELNGIAVIQYGSSVRGEAVKSSDIDWLVILSPDKKISREVYRQVSQLQKKHEDDPYVQKISVHLAHPPQDFNNLSNFWLEVGLEGVVLIEKNNFSRIVHEIKNLIAIGGYRRKLSGGQPYWINETRGLNAEQGTD